MHGKFRKAIGRPGSASEMVIWESDVNGEELLPEHDDPASRANFDEWLSD